MPSGHPFISALTVQRPRLYHLTASSNVPAILAAGELRPAAHWLERAGERRAIREKRPEHMVVQADGVSVHLRDQAPLHAGNMRLSDGWSMPDFIAHLNGHVFFWPGTTAGPSDYGRRHFERYAGEPASVLVLDTARLIAGNTDPGVRLSRYNSGSPRCSGGQPSPRGPDTFLPPGRFDGTPSTVVEIVFPGPVRLGSALLVVTTPAKWTGA